MSGMSDLDYLRELEFSHGLKPGDPAFPTIGSSRNWDPTFKDDDVDYYATDLSQVSSADLRAPGSPEDRGISAGGVGLTNEDARRLAEYRGGASEGMPMDDDDKGLLFDPPRPEASMPDPSISEGTEPEPETSMTAQKDLPSFSGDAPMGPFSNVYQPSHEDLFRYPEKTISMMNMRSTSAPGPDINPFTQVPDSNKGNIVSMSPNAGAPVAVRRRPNMSASARRRR
jgi:hypothetical protein